jgi:signal transduction histidine kinase
MSSSVAQVLRQDRDAIVAAWAERVRAHPRARGLDRPRLHDDVPPLLERLADAVDDGARCAGVQRLAAVHASQRGELGYDIGEMVWEYCELRSTIVCHMRDRGIVDLTSMERLHAALDEGVVAAVERHDQEQRERARDATRALLQVTETALSAASLDDLLRDLTRRVRGLLGADAATVLLAEGGGTLRLRASDGLESHVGATPPASSPSGRVFASRLPVLLDDVDREAPDPRLQGAAIRSYLGAPLRVDSRTIGVLHVTATEPRRFTPQQSELLLVIADRVATSVERSRLLEEAQRAEAQATAAVHARDALLAAVSHDLRNPLHSILMNAFAMLRTAGGDATARRRAESVQRAATLAVRIIDDLLDAAALEAGSFRLRADDHDARALVQDVLEVHEPLAIEKGLRLESAVDAPGDVRCDREQTVRALGNLVGNALKFTPPGGAVTLRAARVDGHVRFEVADTGPGIDPARLPHIFERGARGPQAEGAGLGLGLPLARAIAEAQGGALGVESAARRGAMFWMKLPGA